jgi:hypothetical protein
MHRQRIIWFELRLKTECLMLVILAAVGQIPITVRELIG